MREYILAWFSDLLLLTSRGSFSKGRGWGFLLVRRVGLVGLFEGMNHAVRQDGQAVIGGWGRGRD